MRTLPADEVIHPDERAWMLTELVQVVHGLPGYRRIQHLFLVRGDEIVVQDRDLGDASTFTAPEFRLPSFNEHTAGELWDIADFNRDRDAWFRNRMREIQGESTLTQDWLNWIEARVKLVNNQSVFGPGMSVQRNGFSLAGAQDALAAARSN